MKTQFQFTLVALVVITAAGADWLQFRGTDQKSVAAAAKMPPTEWSVGAKESAKKNLAWSVEVAARGVGGPIVVGNQVIVTGADGAAQERLHVYSFSTADGSLQWHRQFWATGRTFCHPVSSVAAPTPACDGQRIYAFYSSNDLVCLGLDGSMLWYRGLTLEHPSSANDVGMASSPLVVGDTVIVQIESKGESFAAGFDAATGEDRWRIPRPSEMNWCSPTLLRNEGNEPLVLLQSPEKLSAHNPKTGATLWTFDSKSGGIPSPTTVGDMIYMPGDKSMIALRSTPGSENWENVWQEPQLAAGNSSPIIHGTKIFVVNKAGALTCGETSDGKVAWRQRLKGRFWATPVLIGDYLYCVNSDGVAQVVKSGTDGAEIVSEADFGEPVYGSPAYADGALYFRGDKHLWKIAQP